MENHRHHSHCRGRCRVGSHHGRGRPCRRSGGTRLCRHCHSGAHAFAGTAAAGSALGEAAVLGAVGVGAGVASLSEDGELELTDDMRAKVLDYYDENYRSWLYLASSEKEFAEIAWKNIASFMERNSR